MSNGQDIPRWAAPLGTETWDRINELLHDGWDTMDIVRAVELPKEKVRSLQVYARKFGPRRRLLLFAKFKDALLEGAAAMGDDFARAMSLVAANAVSEDVKPSTQQKACALMTEFAKTISKMMATDEQGEAERAAETKAKVSGSKEALSREAIEKIRAIYGLAGDGER